jgi:hypothetical protein
VYLIAKPPQDIIKVPLTDLRADLGDLTDQGLKELRAGHRAEGIGGKIPKGPIHPMNILQASILIRGRSDSDEAAHLIAPRVGQISDLELTAQHLTLKTIAQDHMRGIGDLIGVDAD